MSDEWRQITLDEVLTFSNGASSPERCDGGSILVFGSNGPIGLADEANAPATTIIIGRVGSYCGSLRYSDRPCWVTDNAIRANAKGEHSPSFLFYLLQTLNLNSWRGGSGQPLLNQRTLSAIPCTVPVPAAQRAIAAVLGSLDEKIEQNRLTSRKLEAFARAVFKAWFVDFEPVKAKAAGATAFPGMPPETFAAIPSTLQDSPLGPVPEGWEVGTMGDVCTQRREQIAPKVTDGETPYIGLEHMPRRDIALSDWGTAASVTSSKFRFRRGDVLFGKLRPYFHKVGPAPFDGVCSTDIVVLYPKQPEYAAWLLMLVSSDEFVAHSDRSSAGTKMPRTNWKDMAAFGTTVPPSQPASGYQDQVGPMLDLIIASIHESRRLAALRDYLLPRLLSGNVRVSSLKELTAGVPQ